MFVYLRNKNIESMSTFNSCSQYRSCLLKAFTLSEVLVAMAIMGILCAVVVPVIMQSKPDSQKVMFRKALSSLQFAVNNMVQDAVNYPKEQTGTDASGLTVEKGFNYTTATSNGTVNKFCYFLTQQLNTVGTVSCPAATGGTQTGSFITSDGSEWYLYIKASDDIPDTQFPLSSIPASAGAVYPVMLYVDVNGSSNPPNCTASTAAGVIGKAQCSVTADCSKDPDIFVFDIRYDGRIHIGGYSGSVYKDKCAESIIADPGSNKKG